MKMRAIQVTRANGPFEIVERGIPEPGTEQARAKIDGCGICHSDGLTEEGIWPGIRYGLKAKAAALAGTAEIAATAIRAAATTS